MTKTALMALSLLAAPLASAGESLDLDKASVEQLASLQHVDESGAKAIVELREARGGHISSVEALRVLPGIDGAALSEIRGSTEVQIQVPMGRGKTYSSAEEVLAEFDSEPSIQQVQSWATHYAKLNPELVDRWLRQSHTFAMLPILQLEYRLHDDWDQDFKYVTGEGTTPGPGDTVESVLEDGGTGQDSYYTVRARWDLNELIMSSESIRVINESQDIVKLRDKVLSETTQLYFERRRVQVDMLLSPPDDIGGQVQGQIRLMELTASIDAYTGGRFSEALSR
ncbi:MAG: helix-hairpin-helix domain-containing protein [Proteobacteria bacterium]|nr:helix-hairpin-helix domain-containing protein [Pseudomonadota bacterium]